MRKLYKILGLPLGASKTDIKKAYRNMVQKHHPDKGGSAEIFRHMNVAYEILSGKRKPSRSEMAEYGERIVPPKKPKVKTPEWAKPKPVNITKWPPEHLKEHWKQKRPTVSPKGTLRSMKVHDPTFYKKFVAEPRKCSACNGSGREKVMCDYCDGTGNMVLTDRPLPAIIRKCVYCNGKKYRSVGVCSFCRGQGR